MKTFFKVFGIFLMLSIFSAFAEDKPAPDKSDESYKPFAEVTKGAEKIEGLFTFYKMKEGKIYMEIAPDKLDTPFIILMNLTGGIGERGLLAGMPLDDYLFTFHKVNEQIQFIEKNPFFTANPKSPLSKNLKTNFTTSILASMKIVSINPDKKSILVPAEELFLVDLPDLDRLVGKELKGNYTFDPTKSSIEKVQAFPVNDEIDVIENLATTTEPKEAAYLTAIPDWRSIPLTVHFSLSSLPTGSYEPRPADDRIGYFLSSMRDFSNPDPDSPYVRYINRWNLQNKPIVFWIENTTPYEFRDAVKAGALEWNKAFAKIGIPDAIDVKIQPDEAAWSSDIRYNLIRWLDSSEPKFAGFGPSHVNPLTGEIYHASVLIDGTTIQDLERIYRYEIGLHHNNSIEKLSKPCLYQNLEAEEAEQGLLDLMLNSPEPVHFNVPKSFLDAYIKSLVMHEVGHALGLRHNFKGSTFHTLVEVQDAELTKKTGLSASVMDYLPINLANSKQKQGEYFYSTIGPYDYWAIAYGYTPDDSYKLLPALSTRHEYAYATDEDTDSPYSIDPHAMTFDLSSDPLGFVENRFILYKEILAKIDKLLPFAGKSYSEVRRAFDMVFSGYENYSGIPVRYLGGQYFSRSHREPGAGIPFRPVEKSEQLRALAILDHDIFSPSAFSFSPEFLNKLAPPRWDDHFTELQLYLTSIDYPILEKIGDLQSSLLSRMLRPVLLARLLDNEKKAASSADRLMLNDYFSWLTDHFWQEIGKSANINTMRRNLQRNYLRRLLALAVAPKSQIFAPSEIDIPPMPIASVPADARSLAMRQLRILRSRIQTALGNKSLDPETRSHFERSVGLIDRVINARFQESLDDKGTPPSDEP